MAYALAAPSPKSAAVHAVRVFVQRGLDAGIGGICKRNSLAADGKLDAPETALQKTLKDLLASSERLKSIGDAENKNKTAEALGITKNEHAEYSAFNKALKDHLSQFPALRGVPDSTPAVAAKAAQVISRFELHFKPDSPYMVLYQFAVAGLDDPKTLDAAMDAMDASKVNKPRRPLARHEGKLPPRPNSVDLKPAARRQLQR